jgi:Family of unknown function (DUF6508)
MSSEFTRPSRADLAWLTGQIERLEQPGLRFGEWRSHEPSARKEPNWWYWSPSQEVDEFLRGLYQHHLIIEFDWSNWERLEHYKARPEAVQGAPLEDCLKLLTAHVRADRFVEGHFASTLESGEMQRLLRRICELLEAEGGGT